MKYIFIYGIAFNALRMLVGAISAMYLLEKGLSLYDLGLLKTIQALIILFLDVPLAYIADRYSRKLSIILSVAFSSVWLFIMGFASEKWLFFLAEAFNAISIALIGGSFISYLIDSHRTDGSPSEIKFVIAKFNKFQFLAMGVGAFLGAAFIQIDSEYIWFFSGMLCLILLFFFSWFLPSDVCHTKDASESKATFSDDFKKITKMIITDKKILLPMGFSLVVIMSFYQILIQFWQPFSFGLFDKTPKDGILYGSLFSAILLAQSFSSHIADKIEKIEDLARIGNVIGFIALLISLLGIFYSPYFIFISVVLMFLGNRLTTIALQSVFHSVIESSFRSTFDSFVSSSLRLIIIFLLPLVGFFIEVIGWIIVPLLLIFSMLFSFYFSGKEFDGVMNRSGG